MVFQNFVWWFKVNAVKLKKKTHFKMKWTFCNLQEHAKLRMEVVLPPAPFGCRIFNITQHY